MIKFITSTPHPHIKLQSGTLDEIRQWSAGRISVCADTETTGLHPLLYKMLLLIIGDEDTQFVVDLRSTPKAEVTRLLDDLKHLKWVFHNSKFDYSFIKAHYGVELRNLYCTYLGSQILMNGYDTSHSLAHLVKTSLDITLNKQQRNTFINKKDHDPFTEDEIKYAADDIQYLKYIAQEQMNFIKIRNQQFLINLENKVTPVVANMELKGIDLDIPKWKYIAKNNKSRSWKVELLMDRELYNLSRTYEGLRGGAYTRKRLRAALVQTDLFGIGVTKENANNGNVNYGSSTQILEIFSRCGIDLDSASEDALMVFMKNNPTTDLKKFIDLLLYYKKLKKRLSTYGESFLEFVNPVTGRIHTNFTQCYTDTGRFSSGDSKDDQGRKLNWFVNFQNIPALTEYRSCFTVPSDDYDYITLDLSGAEIVIAASNSQDPLLLKSITEKLDLHSMLATKSYTIIRKMMGRDYKTVTPVQEDGTVIVTKKDEQMRNDHKPVLFGIMYMAGAKRISELLDIPEEIAKKVLNGIFELLPEMKKYLNKTAKGALRNGFITANPVTNRRRYFTADARENIAYKVEKEACNFPIQGTNADMIKMSLVAIDQYIHDNKLDAWIINTVHDEISVVAHKDISDQVYKDVQRIMEESANKFLVNVTMSSSGGKKKFWSK